MTKNFSNLFKEKDTQVQEAQRVPNNMHPKRPTPRHVIIKMAKLKDRENLKREKQLVTYKGAPIKLLSAF